VSKTIYVVTTGEYSDYGIVAMFTTKEDAQRFIDVCGERPYSSFNDIEEYELDASVPQIRKGFSPWWVQMDEHGNTFNAEVNTFGKGIVRKPDDEFRGATRLRERWFNWYGWSKDREHALKIANEHRIGLLAKATLSGGAVPERAAARGEG
jgi:hypothetical protein